MIFYSELFIKIPERCIIKLLFIVDTSTLGIPNLHTMLFQTKFLTFCYVIFAKGSASTHLVK